MVLKCGLWCYYSLRLVLVQASKGKQTNSMQSMSNWLKRNGGEDPGGKTTATTNTGQQLNSNNNNPLIFRFVSPYSQDVNKDVADSRGPARQQYLEKYMAYQMTKGTKKQDSYKEAVHRDCGA